MGHEAVRANQVDLTEDRIRLALLDESDIAAKSWGATIFLSVGPILWHLIFADLFLWLQRFWTDLDTQSCHVCPLFSWVPLPALIIVQILCCGTISVEFSPSSFILLSVNDSFLNSAFPFPYLPEVGVLVSFPVVVIKCSDQAT